MTVWWIAANSFTEETEKPPDADGDGDSDLQEITAGTNPANAEDFTPGRIGYFPTDSVMFGWTPTFLDVNGQAPTSKVGVEQVAGRKGKAARLNEITDFCRATQWRPHGRVAEYRAQAGDKAFLVTARNGRAAEVLETTPASS